MDARIYPYVSAPLQDLGIKVAAKEPQYLCCDTKRLTLQTFWTSPYLNSYDLRPIVCCESHYDSKR